METMDGGMGWVGSVEVIGVAKGAQDRGNNWSWGVQSVGRRGFKTNEGERDREREREKKRK